MAKSVLELAVGTGQWNAGLKKAKSALDNFTQSQGGLQQALAKDSDSMQKFVRMMGQADSTAKTAKGQMNDYKSTIEQLTMQYNRMTDAQKKTVGQDYLQAIDQMKQKYQAVSREIQQMNQSLNETKMPDIGGKVGGGLFSGDKLSGMLQVFGGNLMTKAAGWAASFASEMGDMVKQGIELAKQGEGIRIAFERLGRGDILDGLREATHGTVTDLELMKAAVKFNDFRLPLEELGTMLAFAQQKAKDTGQSVDYMVDSIVTGLGRKSLMILDNLGLSAAEIKEKMAETGDMTKAVGAIIRDQMSKAGDYVETAADRAAQANVSLQNKMEELGRKFGPLEQASTQFWTSMKIGILDVVGGPLARLLNGLTEAGRLMNQQMDNDKSYQRYGGSTKVDNLISYLGSGNGLNALNTYRKQLAIFDRHIAQKQSIIAGIGNPKDGIEQTLLQKTKADLAGIERMRSEYVRRAQELHKKATTKIVEENKEEEQSIDSLNKKLKDLQEQRKKAIAAGDTDLSKSLMKQINQTKADIRGLDPNALKTGGKKNPVYVEGSIAAQEQLVQDLTKKWKEADASMRDYYKDLLGYAEQTLRVMKGGFDPSKIGPIADLTGRVPTIGMGTDMKRGKNGKWYDATAPVAPSEIKFSDGLQKWLNYMQKQDSEKKEVNLTSEMSKIAGGVSGIFSGIESLGVELPQGLKDVMGGIQGMISILTSISTIVTAIQAISAADTLIPFARGGVVRAAVGYEVPGNHFSGDMVPALLNSGETVLNRAQSGIIASALEGAGGGFKNGQIVGVLEGEKIKLVLNRHYKRIGEGEVVTWRS